MFFHFLSTQTGRIDQREHHSLFQERWRGKKLLEFLMVQDDRQFGVFFQ